MGTVEQGYCHLTVSWLVRTRGWGCRAGGWGEKGDVDALSMCGGGGVNS
jgi:hypothetical protein